MYEHIKKSELSRAARRTERKAIAAATVVKHHNESDHGARTGVKTSSGPRSGPRRQSGTDATAGAGATTGRRRPARGIPAA